MTRPSFQFYPGDWASNPNLKRCSFAEKGVWLEVMCLMHDQSEYGVLRWPLKEIAEAVKCKVADLQALIRKEVLKGDDKHLHTPFVYVPRSGRKDGDPVTLIDTQEGPIWYSSRMVKDEYVRTLRADSGGNGDASKPSPKGGLGEVSGEPIGGGFGPRGSSSSSSTRAEEANASSSSKPTVVPCPYDQIIEAYHEALPSLPRVLLKSPSRQKAIRGFWGWVLSSKKSDGTARATNADEAMAWIHSYFVRANDNDFLMGRTAKSDGHENWTCDFDFLLTERGKKQIIEKTRAAA